MFALTAVPALVSLGTTLAVLSGSGIASSFVGAWYYNWCTRVYYRISMLWMGQLVYLFFAAVAYGLAVGVSGMLIPWAGMGCMALALAVGAYGAVHARQVVVTSVSVALPGLPAAWRGRTAIWISDLHLGQVYGVAFVHKLVRMIHAIPHDIVFIGGDVFDGTTAPDIESLASQLGKIASPLGAYFITGNHEEFRDGTRFLAAIQSAGIHTLVDEMVDIDGLQLIGVDYRHASQTEQFREILSRLPLDARKPSILLKHVPSDIDVACEAGVSLQISGHTHRGQQWPFEYVARLTYKGLSYGLHTVKNMQVYVSSGVGTWGPPMRVGTDCEIVVFSFQ
jgi:hypothetical protein